MEAPVRHTFKILSGIPGLTHGVFTRHGGVSRAPYATLNVAWNNGDSQGAVRENLRRVRESLGVHRLASAFQVHGDTIRVVDEETITNAPAGSDLIQVDPCDGLITRLKGTGLMIKIADCQAIFIVDPIRQVIANIHCGWRGSVLDLPRKAVKVMEDRFGCRPEDLVASISPSLGPCHAEFRNYRDELPESFLAFQTAPLHFDFWAASRRQLIDSGLSPERIETAGRCTVCETGDFFSYRGEKETGRMAAVIAWDNGSSGPGDMTTACRVES